VILFSFNTLGPNAAKNGSPAPIPGFAPPRRRPADVFLITDSDFLKEDFFPRATTAAAAALFT
jgi:hypothetical protein